MEDVAIYQKKYAKTYRKAAQGEEGDDESAATEQVKVITQLPWEDLEREEDKKAMQKYCIQLAKKEDLLLKLEP